MEDAIEIKWRNQQQEICLQYAVERVAPALGLNSGVSDDIVHGRFFDDGIWPLNGIRHPPTASTTGWYLWAGELSPADDFFKPVHTVHLETWCADVVPYLGLPPGWGVQIAPGHLDVWFDPAFLLE